MRAITVGLIGEYDAAVIAHQAIPRALDLAAKTLDADVHHEWIPTAEIVDAARVSSYDGVWCVPATPYQNMDGALRAIRFAREAHRPLLGTCGGFQHVMVEYARNVMGWADAEHAETAPDTVRPVIAPLACSLIEMTDVVRFVPGSKLAAAYGREEATEGYHCRYGLNPAFREALTGGPLRVTADDRAGDVRGVELDGHPFFVATLFQSERRALTGRMPPIVGAFVYAICNEQKGLSTISTAGS